MDTEREDGSAALKLVVGLGNPGRKYDGTRHNIGFEVLAELARRSGGASPKAKFEGEVVETHIGSQRAILLAPSTFMNLSGRSVRKAFDFYKLQAEDLVVVCDDFNLPIGKLRFRPSGSAGGQNGLSDIIRALGTQEVPRLRVGIGPVPERWNPADFVLAKYTKDERQTIDEMVVQAADAIETWSRQGSDDCMNQFN